MTAHARAGRRARLRLGLVVGPPVLGRRALRRRAGPVLAFECLVGLGALARETSSIRLGTLVLCEALRPIGVLAQALSTIDRLSDGRLEVGIGAGYVRARVRGDRDRAPVARRPPGPPPRGARRARRAVAPTAVPSRRGQATTGSGRRACSPGRSSAPAADLRGGQGRPAPPAGGRAGRRLEHLLGLDARRLPGPPRRPRPGLRGRRPRPGLRRAHPRALRPGRGGRRDLRTALAADAQAPRRHARRRPARGLAGAVGWSAPPTRCASRWPSGPTGRPTSSRAPGRCPSRSVRSTISNCSRPRLLRTAPNPGISQLTHRPTCDDQGIPGRRYAGDLDNERTPLDLGPPELLIILVIFMLLFGARSCPSSPGRSASRRRSSSRAWARAPRTTTRPQPKPDAQDV